MSFYFENDGTENKAKSSECISFLLLISEKMYTKFFHISSRLCDFLWTTFYH